MLHAIYLVAIVAEAMSGAIMGIHRRLDLFGIALIGTITALGGGTIRDLLLGHYPLGWIAHPEYLVFTIGATVLTTFVAQHVHRLRKIFLLVDALGLVAFTIIGCDVARTMMAPPGIAIIAGMVTGVFGGLLRDVLCNEIPLVLRRDLYASVSLITGALYLGLLYLGWKVEPASSMALFAGFVLRLLAIRFAWQLPTVTPDNVRGFE